MPHPKPARQMEIIGRWEYFSGPDGDLYRAHRSEPEEMRKVEFVAPHRNAEFALRLARIAAGLPEFGDWVKANPLGPRPGDCA